MHKNRKVSFVVPCYNEQTTIPIYYETMNALLKNKIIDDLLYEFVFVDDGSTDDTLKVLEELQMKDENVSNDNGKFENIQYESQEFIVNNLKKVYSGEEQ